MGNGRRCALTPAKGTAKGTLFQFDGQLAVVRKAILRALYFVMEEADSRQIRLDRAGGFGRGLQKLCVGRQMFAADVRQLLQMVRLCQKLAEAFAGCIVPLFRAETALPVMPRQLVKSGNQGTVNVLRCGRIDRGHRITPTKISMYQDLAQHRERLKAHPVLRAFAGARGEVSLPADLSGELSHDNRPSSSEYQVLRADSSQMDAITLSRRGVSFVMQGPPGTGKARLSLILLPPVWRTARKFCLFPRKWPHWTWFINACQKRVLTRSVSLCTATRPTKRKF